MISVDEARSRILAGLKPVSPETVALNQAHKRVLAQPLHSRLTVPPADVSAMDGYALRAADATPNAELRLVGEAPAGHPFSGHVGVGQTVRLFTGSVVPDGADAVLIQENTTVIERGIKVLEPVDAGKNIRRAGQDFAAGEQVLPAGKRLSIRDIGLAGAAGHPWLYVYRRPRVAILCTGDEIALPGEPLPAGGIANSNAAMLAAFVSAYGAEPILLPIAKDTQDAIVAGAQAAQGADILLTTGGASVGAHDLVQVGLAQQGFALDFWKIAMRPGKPLIFGHVQAMPMLGLPGNPVSAYVCATLFLGAALARLSGLPAAAPRFETARLAAPMKTNDQREDYVRALLSRDEAGLVVKPLPVQDSSMLSALSQASALIRRLPFAPAAEAGVLVEVLLMEQSD